MDVELAEPYRTSSFCGGGNCVEIARFSNGDISVRDAENRTARFSVQEWEGFVRGVKSGEFDFGR